jgi:hypothetical protein
LTFGKEAKTDEKPAHPARSRRKGISESLGADMAILPFLIDLCGSAVKKRSDLCEQHAISTERSMT